MYDIIIIGGGVTGASIARELSKFRLKICLLEKQEDVATASSRANSAIVHAGYDCKPDTLMARLNVDGNRMYDKICEDLDVPFKRIGSMVIAFNEAEVEELQHLLRQGEQNGVPDLKILSKDEALEIEPGLNKDVIAALWAPSGGITCPYELTLAMAENAVLNGVEVFLNWEVTAIHKESDDFFTVSGGDEKLCGRYVINAAGLYGDQISKMAGAEEFTIVPRKGEYHLLDRSQRKIAQTVIFQAPGPMGKGVLVTPTVDGNLLVGPNASDQKDKQDTSTTELGLKEVMELSHKSIPKIPFQKIITSFAGLRAVSDRGDFIIEASGKVKGFIQAAGICSPGLTSAPAIGPYISEILKEEGLNLIHKPSYNPKRKGIPHFHNMTWDERREIVKKNPSYGHIICRCETVTEGEIIEAIYRPIPANSLDGIKRRTRAGMGRCQGGFCSPRVMEILSREKEIPMEKVTKFGGNSWIISGRIKEMNVREEL